MDLNAFVPPVDLQLVESHFINDREKLLLAGSPQWRRARVVLIHVALTILRFARITLTAWLY